MLCYYNYWSRRAVLVNVNLTRSVNRRLLHNLATAPCSAPPWDAAPPIPLRPRSIGYYPLQSELMQADYLTRTSLQHSSSKQASLSASNTAPFFQTASLHQMGKLTQNRSSSRFTTPRSRFCVGESTSSKCWLRPIIERSRRRSLLVRRTRRRWASSPPGSSGRIIFSTPR